ncbi:hypothetical protein [Planktomarina temperata]|uniref:Uncharacterized protein n=1 Tax=Planktomarina temperata RCA23 TaxID=666509 RepID=A0AAN0VI99_9RHOB|nr:hypothetical protein RCA23_c12400 [Planktomarina temperata RCA23]
MSTNFEPTMRIKISQLQSICAKYNELELIMLNHQIDKSTQKDDGGCPIAIDQKDYAIQSYFKKDLVYPYREFKNESSNFITLNCLKDHSTESDYYVNYFRMAGVDPYHIVRIIQYETEIVINDEYTIDDYLRYEHFGIDYSKSHPFCAEL